MSKKIILFLLMSFSLRALAKGECSDAQNRHWSAAGFTVQADCGIAVTDGTSWDPADQVLKAGDHANEQAVWKSALGNTVYKVP